MGLIRRCRMRVSGTYCVLRAANPTYAVLQITTSYPLSRGRRAASAQLQPAIELAGASAREAHLVPGSAIIISRSSVVQRPRFRALPTKVFFLSDCS